MQIKLKDLSIGDSATIIGYEKPCGYRKRLLALGFLQGTTIKLIRIVPLGDPMEISIRGSQVSIRKEEASILIIDSVQPHQVYNPEIVV